MVGKMRGEERSIGAIIYAALSPDYNVYHLIFTDKQYFAINASALNKKQDAAFAGASIGALGLFLQGMNPSTAYGISYLAGINAWNAFKKKIKKDVALKAGEVPQRLLSLAEIKVPYEKIKGVRIQKIMLSDDYLLSLNSGFWSSWKWVIPQSSLNDVKSLLKKTPLSDMIEEK